MGLIWIDVKGQQACIESEFRTGFYFLNTSFSFGIQDVALCLAPSH